MNRIKNVIKNFKVSLNTVEPSKEENIPVHGFENKESINTKNEVLDLNFNIPELLNYFPDLVKENKLSSSLKGDIGQLICGTISTYFEDTWSKNIEELKKNKFKLNLNNLFEFGSDIYLNREWHRLWFIRSFLSFCWENYLEDILKVNEYEQEYIKLPCYGTELKDINKIPLGEIACIVSNTFLNLTNKHKVSIPFSTIQGKIINKTTISINKPHYWKTPPPNSVAKFIILDKDLTIISDEIYLSLNVDKPKLLWKNKISDIFPKEFDDYQLISSCIRVLRKNEIAKFIINQKIELNIELLHWYRETFTEIKYGDTPITCKFIIIDFEINKQSFSQKDIQYFVTSNDSSKRKLFNIKINNYQNFDSPLITNIMEKSNKAIIYLSIDLVINELKILKPFSENLKLINTFENILNGLKNGKEYFFHIEKTIHKEKDGNILLFEHIFLNKKCFEYRYKILYDLFTFSKLVIPKLKLKRDQSIIVQDIFIKNLGNNNSLIEFLIQKFNDKLFNCNYFQIPYILIDIDEESKDNYNSIYFVSPCIKNNSELLFYSLINELKVDIRKKLFNISLNKNFNKLFINDVKLSKNQFELTNMFYYKKGISLIKELGGFYFEIEKKKVFELSDNRYLEYLDIEMSIIKDNLEQIDINNGTGLFLHLIKTCFFIFQEKYNNSQSFELKQVYLKQMINIETKKKNNYFKIIGILTEILLNIEMNDKISIDLIEDLVEIIREGMKHISIIKIFLFYLVTWIILQVSNYNEQIDKDLILKEIIQDLLKFHRICRQFLNENQKDIEKYLKISKKNDIEEILNIKLCLKMDRVSNINNKVAFFKLLINNNIFDYLLILMYSNSSGITDSINDKYYNLLKNDFNYSFFSIGNNKNGSLGIGIPKINIFNDIECKLFPYLEEINKLYLKKGLETDITKNLQRIIFKDNYLLEKGILSFCYGTDHVLILQKNGSLLSWGSNIFGQCCQKKKDIDLDISKIDDKNMEIFKKKLEEYENLIACPTEISYFSNLNNKTLISMISCGSNFSLAVDTNGNLFSWGQGKDGCLGNGTLDDSFTPQKIYFKLPIKLISSGMFHCAAIDADDQLYLWGSNEVGQLGIQLNEISKIISIPCKINIGICYNNTSEIKLIIQNDIKLVEKYLNKQNNQYSRLVKWKNVCLGEGHSIALDDQGIIWVWGQNNFKQLTIIPEKLNLKFLVKDEKNISEYYSKLNSIVSLPTPLISTPQCEVFNSRKINIINSGAAACCAIDELGKPWIWGLVFSGIDNHLNSSFLFTKSSNTKNKQYTELKEIGIPVRVFRNMTNDDDSIKIIKFGKGNNSISMISKYGKCYLWLENKNLVVEQMKYLTQHNCYIIYNLNSQSKFDDQYSVIDIALLNDSIIFFTKKKKSKYLTN